MSLYNCPDCIFFDRPCGDCPRVTRNHDEERGNRLPQDYHPLEDLLKDYNTIIPSCCRNCSNHPFNGGSGMCHCTLPYYDPEWATTCGSASDTNVVTTCTSMNITL